MAETCTVAFGRYLKMLRERRGFSLDEVASMSRSLADPVSKGYLSRCENGRHGAGFSKVVTLARVYGVPFEVLAERVELDTELDRLGGPDTTGMTYREMQKKAAAALNRGAFWEAYGLARDSLPQATLAPVSPNFRDTNEQAACACMNVSTTAGRLGRSKYALHELEHVQGTGHISEKHAPALLDLLSSRYREVGQTQKAKDLADQALKEAEQDGSKGYLGFCLTNRARFYCDEADWVAARAMYQRAIRAFGEGNLPGDQAKAMLNIASTYLDQKLYRAARRAASAAEHMATPLHQTRVHALVRLLLGHIDAVEDRPSQAVEHWREAIDLARSLRDKILLFMAIFATFRHALSTGDLVAASNLKRRLSRLAPWIPEDVSELREFRAIAHSVKTDRAKRVAWAQLTDPPSRNP